MGRELEVTQFHDSPNMQTRPGVREFLAIDGDEKEMRTRRI